MEDGINELKRAYDGDYTCLNTSSPIPDDGKRILPNISSMWDEDEGPGGERFKEFVGGGEHIMGDYSLGSTPGKTSLLRFLTLRMCFNFVFQDGEPHLHIAVCLKKRKNIKSAAYFDPVGEKHGDYKVMKTYPKTIAYCKKEDKQPLIIGELPLPVKK